jgi:hypothetical protein
VATEEKSKYFAHNFQLNKQKEVKFRMAKITPTKQDICINLETK